MLPRWEYEDVCLSKLESLCRLRGPTVRHCQAFMGILLENLQHGDRSHEHSQGMNLLISNIESWHPSPDAMCPLIPFLHNDGMNSPC